MLGVTFVQNAWRWQSIRQRAGNTDATTTGVGSGGYAGDLTPPTIYVEGILICISPLEKPNT